MKMMTEERKGIVEEKGKTIEEMNEKKRRNNS